MPNNNIATRISAGPEEGIAVEWRETVSERETVSVRLVRGTTHVNRRKTSDVYIFFATAGQWSCHAFQPTDRRLRGSVEYCLAE